MPLKKGFSLVELIVAVVILGITAAIAIPCYIDSAGRSAAQNAQSNLVAICAGYKTYRFNNSSSFLNIYGLSTINSTLNLSLIDDGYFTYGGTFPWVSATGVADATFQLSVNCSNGLTLNQGPAGNPGCSYPAHQSLCPS